LASFITDPDLLLIDTEALAELHQSAFRGQVAPSPFAVMNGLAAFGVGCGDNSRVQRARSPIGGPEGKRSAINQVLVYVESNV